jgi:formyltetrahydrofolate synthetase
MAVIFAVVGGGAVVGIATTPTPGDSNYHDYSDYSDYDNYSNYSDAAERRQRRIENKKREIDSQKVIINSYKTDSVNSYLQSSKLKQMSGVDVSLTEVKNDGDKKIDDQVRINSDRETADLKVEIEKIDTVMDKIEKILKEGD